MFINATVIGQTRNSYKNYESPDSDPPRASVRAKIDSAKTIFSNDPLGAFESVESAINMAVQYGYKSELAEAYFTLSGFNMSMGEYNSSILHLNRALPIYESQEKWEKVYETDMLLGKSYFALKDYDQAQTYFKDAESLAKKGGRKEAHLKATYESANVLVAQAQYDKAEREFNQLRDKAVKENLNDLVAEIDFKLGEIYELRGDFYQANTYFVEATDNAIQTKNPDLLNKTNERMVQSYYNSTDGVANGFDGQMVFNSLNEAESYFIDEKDTVALLENSIQKADLYAVQGDLDDAVQELNFSYDLSQEYGDLDKQVSTQKKLYDVYAQTNQSEEAIEAYQNYQLLLDSANRLKEMEKGLANQEQMALRNVEKQIDVLERERKLNQETIRLLEKEQDLNNTSLRQQRVLLYVLGFILIVFIFVGVIVYRNTKEKKRAHQLLYLKSLRAQMNPHFIFNSLNSVNNYIAKSNERAANKYLSKFSKLMRQVLEYSQVEFISLTREIEVLQLYVELEHERFKDKFDFDFVVDDSINTDTYTIPPMLVQPFIENAVWHGLRYKESKGMLEVRFKDMDDYVEISVKDNGIGRQKSQELKTINQKKHNSSGMRNVENRTEMIQAVFRTKISYDIIDLPENSGTQVMIKLYQNANK